MCACVCGGAPPCTGGGIGLFHSHSPGGNKGAPSARSAGQQRSVRWPARRRGTGGSPPWLCSGRGEGGGGGGGLWGWVWWCGCGVEEGGKGVKAFFNPEALAVLAHWFVPPRGMGVKWVGGTHPTDSRVVQDVPPSASNKAPSGQPTRHHGAAMKNWPAADGPPHAGSTSFVPPPLPPPLPPTRAH